MGNRVRQIQMRTANNRPQDMNLEFIHYGTTDFFKPQIIHCQAVNPGETVDLTTIVNIKGKPMMMPGEIQLKHNLRAFWVPNFATHKDWFAFRTNTPFKFNNQGTYARHEEDYYFYNTWLINTFYAFNSEKDEWIYIDEDNLEFFAGEAVKPEDAHGAGSIIYDVYLAMFEKQQDESIDFKGTMCFNLTNRGRILINMLQQLGYEINWQYLVDTQDGIDWTKTAKEILGNFHNGFQPTLLEGEAKLSARPLLSFLKIMIDYYVPSQYENYYQDTFEKILEHGAAVDIDGAGPYEQQGVYQLINELITWVNYEIDRFTGAWKNPTGPNNEGSNIQISDITMKDQNGLAMNKGSEGSTPIAIPGQGERGENIVTDYLLRALDAIQNFTTRNRIAGYRPIDRFLAHFGKRLDYIHTKRAQYIDGNTNNLAVIDVTAMAQTNGATAGKSGMNDAELLGGQAAKVSGQNGISVKWTADDDGWIFIIDTIVPRNGYFQGLKNHCLRVNWLDLYNPEFDNLGTQPLRRIELFHASEGCDTPLNDEQIWGFEPTYMGMKTGWDTKSGDRRIRTLNAGLEAMDTLRTFDSQGENLPQSVDSSFIKGEQKQYDRIFQYMNDNVDHYYFTAKTTDNGAKPMKSVSESLPLTDGEGNVTEWQYGGSNYLQ